MNSEIWNHKYQKYKSRYLELIRIKFGLIMMEQDQTYRDYY